MEQNELERLDKIRRDMHDINYNSNCFKGDVEHEIQKKRVAWKKMNFHNCDFQIEIERCGVND